MKKIITLFSASFISLFSFTGCEEINNAEMNYDNTYSSESLIILIATVVVFALIVYLVNVISFFKKELRYINNEIKRNSGREKEYWLKRRRRLWLSLIPFVPY